MEYTIERLGHQGDGIAEGPVFAPRTLPGEVVSGTLQGDRLADVRILSPSGERVQPDCPHYRACGGCHLMHASDGFVAAWKQEVVRNALSAQGLEAEFRPLHTSPPASRRRAVFAARRTKKGALAGFHGRASGTIIEVPGCLLVEPEILRGRELAAELAVLGASRKGALAVTVALSESGLDVAVSGGKELDGPLQAALAQRAEQYGLARLAWDNEIIAARLPAAQRFGKALVVPPPGAFLQATQAGEAALLGAVSEIVGGRKRVVDLFAGCGTFSLPLAESAEVHSVEGDGAMLRALDRGWREAQGLKRVTIETRDLFRRPMMAEELSRFDAAVIDPPRAGAEAQVAELADARIPVIAAVSCNPVSFARDAKTLVSAGYRLDWVQVVDQFRWSPHVELAASLTLPM